MEIGIFKSVANPPHFCGDVATLSWFLLLILGSCILYGLKIKGDLYRDFTIVS